MPEPKAQHFIPKFYLKGFTDASGSLRVCEKFKPIRESKPKDEANRPDYYTHTAHGERDETAEKVLEGIESRAAPVVRKLANPGFNPTPEQMSHVYLFVAFMFTRVPSWREYLDNMFGKIAREKHMALARDKEKFYKSCADMERDTGEPLNMDYEELRQYAAKGDYRVVQSSRAYNLGSMIESAAHLAGILRHFNYELLYAPKGVFFVTSDSPVVTVRPDGGGKSTIGMGFARPGVQVHFPLNKRVFLRMRKNIMSWMLLIGERRVREINRLTMATATRYLYSSESYRTTSRLFDQWGCQVSAGKNAYMLEPESPQDQR
jgi:hypothetical protein